MADKDKVVFLNFEQKHLAENEMVKAIKDVVYQFAGRVTIASTFGVLEIVKNDLEKELLP